MVLTDFFLADKVDILVFLGRGSSSHVDLDWEIKTPVQNRS